MSTDDELQREYEEMLTGDPQPYIDELLDLRVKHAGLHDQHKAAVTNSVRLALEMSDVKTALERARNLAGQFEAQLAAVAALHQVDGWGICASCRVQWPCATAVAAGYLVEAPLSFGQGGNPVEPAADV